MSQFLYLPEISDQHNSMHRFLFSNTLKFLREIATSVPTSDTLPVGFAQFFDEGTVRRLYINFSGAIVYFEGKNT